MNIYEGFFLTYIFAPFQTTSEAGMLLNPCKHIQLLSTITYFVTIKLILKKNKKNTLLLKKPSNQPGDRLFLCSFSFYIFMTKACYNNDKTKDAKF